MKKILIVSVLAVFVGLGGYFSYKIVTNRKYKTSSQPPVKMQQLGNVSFDEVSKHNSASDCWLVVSGSVYNITQYIESGEHPGGSVIASGCGRDATTMFENKHRSSEATDVLSQFKIGELSQS